MGGNYEEDLIPVACSLERAFALAISRIVTVHLHVCVVLINDERDCPGGRELHVVNCPVKYYAPPPFKLGGWDITVIAA